MFRTLIASALLLCFATTSFAQAPAEAPRKTIEQPTPEDEALCDFFNGIVGKTPLDSPERYAVALLRDYYPYLWRLRGTLPASHDELEVARVKLGELKDMIELGRNWPFKKREEVKIPYAKLKPALDGDLDSPAWKQALSFSGEYNLSSLDEIKDLAQWRVMWDEDYLYFAAKFKDPSVKSYEYGIKGKPSPWDGDCLEVFILPSFRMKAYWEIVVNPENKKFDGFHRVSRYGNFADGHEEDMSGLKHFAKVLPDGYVVEIAVPFKELPNYMLGNKPVAGQTFYFMMVRTEDGQRRSPRPFLYDGHNVFGYFEAELLK